MSDDKDDKKEEWVYDGPETFSLTLIKPLKFPSLAEVTELNLSEPTAAQLSQLEQVSQKQGSTAAVCVFIAMNAGIQPKQANLLGARDLQKAINFLMGFFPPDQKPTGLGI